MRRTVLPVVLGLVAVAGLSAAAAVEAGKGDGERLKRLFDRPIKSVQSLRGLTAQPSARLVVRTGLPREALPTIRLYGVVLEREVVPARTAFMDLPWKGKTARMGYSVTSQGGVHGPRAFDEFGKPLTDLDPFLSQFRGHEAVRLSEGSTRPIGEVVQLREEMLAQKKAPPKQSLRAQWALIRHHLLMFEAERLLENLERAAHAEQPLRQPLAELLDHALLMSQFSSNLKAVLEPKEVGQYRQFMAALETEATQAQELLSEGDAGEARERVATQLRQACVKCHDWEQNQWQRSFREGLRDELDLVGFGRGSFVVDVDVKLLDLDRDRAQAVAGVVKAVMLLAHDIDK